MLISLGVAMFVSASLGILFKNEKTFYSVLFNQLVLGLGLGLIGMYLAMKIDLWRFFYAEEVLVNFLIIQTSNQKLK